MDTPTLIQAMGKVVTGDQFWDRAQDVQLLIEQIEARSNVLLVAQRRIGKTSLLAETAERLAGRFICLFVDLQQAKDAPEAMVELGVATRRYSALWPRVKKLFRNVLTRFTEIVEEIRLAELAVTLRSGLTAGDWADKGDQMFQILSESEKPVVLMLDEVPIMVNRMLKGSDFTITPERRAVTDEFMSWLRKNTTRHQGKLAVVLSGSVGLEPVLRQARLSATINHFHALELRPWDEETAIGCLQALANQYGVEFEEDVPQEMVRRLGCCIPHHVQLFFSQAHMRCRRRGQMRCTLADVDEIYKSQMLGPRGHAELTHYEERMEMVLGKELFPLVVEMLTEAAMEGTLTADALAALQENYSFRHCTPAEAQKEILWVLEHDGYLKRGAKGFTFVSNLVQDWWRNRHSLFYVPVSKRGG